MDLFRRIVACSRHLVSGEQRKKWQAKNEGRDGSSHNPEFCAAPPLTEHLEFKARKIVLELKNNNFN